MEWKFNDEAEEKIIEEELPLETVANPVRSGYVAVVGISFDKHGARVEAGKDIPPEFLVDDFVFDWLLNKRGAITLK